MCVSTLGCSHETQLAAEVETGLHLRGELGILKKKLGGFQGRLEELQAQLQHSRALEASLHLVRLPGSSQHSSSPAQLHILSAKIQMSCCSRCRAWPTAPLSPAAALQSKSRGSGHASEVLLEGRSG